jgi:hypothetical protein
MPDVKSEIMEIADVIERDGIISLMDWLISGSDFLTSPASTKYHGNYEGGLADHVLNVHASLTLINNEFPEKPYTKETIAIVALFHDLCKVGTYVEDSEPATEAQIKYLQDLIKKAENHIDPIPMSQLNKFYVSKVIDYLKNGGDKFPEYTPAWKVVDELPLGHGEKSLFIIQKYMEITDDEALAIRWHLGGADPGIQFFYPSGVANKQAVSECPLVSMLVAADYLSSWLLDSKK